MSETRLSHPAEADFIENRANKILDLMSSLPSDIQTAPMQIANLKFPSPDDAFWRMYLNRDFSQMRAIIANIRETALPPRDKTDSMVISTCCRVMSRYLGDMERATLTPVATNLYQAIDAVHPDSLLTLQLYEATLRVDSQTPSDAIEPITDVLAWTAPGENPELPASVRKRLNACIKILQGFPGAGYKQAKSAEKRSSTT